MLKQISSTLEQLAEFLRPFLVVANCHMVDFFTQNHFETYIPAEIRQEIHQLGLESTTVEIFNTCKNSQKGPENTCPNLHKFLRDCKSHTVSNLEICWTLRDFQVMLGQMGCENLQGVHLEMFMSAKKSHEVEIMSEIAATVCQVAKTGHLVDIGDGKGYLSSGLALHNGLKVLGVDASKGNTQGAARRLLKLHKVWKGPHFDPKPSPKPEEKSKVQLYKQITQLVTEEVDLSNLVQKCFKEDSCDRLGLVGLHTCGNLAPCCLRLFISNQKVQTICNVGCCYHLLDESNPRAQNGFPLSDFLQKNPYVLGRNARMLSCQSLDRILTRQELPPAVLFYRAILQALLTEHYPNLLDKQVGRFGKTDGLNFLGYVEKAFKKFGEKLTLSSDEVQRFYDRFAWMEKQLNVFYLLRAHLAPVIESVILLDRLLYLKEQGCERSFLVRLFDPVVSPRCYGLVAFKD